MRYTVTGPRKSQVCTGNGTLRAIVTYLRRRRTPATLWQVASAAGVTRDTARRWLRRLQDIGLVALIRPRQWGPVMAIWLRTKGKSFEALIHRVASAHLRTRPLLALVDAMTRDAVKEAR